MKDLDMFKNVAICRIREKGGALQKAETFQLDGTLADLPRFISKDKKPFFSDVLFLHFEQGYEKHLLLLKANVKVLHEHGIRAHFILAPGYAPDHTIGVDLVEIQRISEAAVHHLIAECHFDGIALHADEKLPGKIRLEYHAKMLASIKRHAKFAGKTLGFFSFPRSLVPMSDIEHYFDPTTEYGPQIASVVDEIHIIGDLDAIDPYIPKASSDPDDKNYASGIPKEKYFTYGDFSYDALQARCYCAYTKAQIDKNHGCKGVTGFYQAWDLTHEPAKMSLRLPVRLVGYSSLLRAATKNAAAEVILAPQKS